MFGFVSAYKLSLGAHRHCIHIVIARLRSFRSNLVPWLRLRGRLLRFARNDGQPNGQLVAVTVNWAMTVNRYQ